MGLGSVSLFSLWSLQREEEGFILLNLSNVDHRGKSSWVREIFGDCENITRGQQHDFSVTLPASKLTICQ
jgi:hypothetical protein